jgi:NAD-dependent dihydropyrimidine dehydrogenase PreA subunit
VSEGRCVRRCPQGSFFLNGLCYDTCPAEARLFTDNACVTVCPRGSVVIDGFCANLTN